MQKRLIITGLIFINLFTFSSVSYANEGNEESIHIHISIMDSNKDRRASKDRKASKRAHLRKVFQETQHIAKNNGMGLDKRLTQKMIQKTTAYRTRRNGNLLALAQKKEIRRPSDRVSKKYLTTYNVVDNDSFVVAKQLFSQGLNPLVLNMANRFSVGGGVEWGSSAQEETLFRSSNYYLSLYPQGRKRANNRTYYIYPISEFGSYYTPNVQVFRDSTRQYKFIKPFSVACIAMAGYDLGKPNKLERNLQGKKGIALLTAFKKYTKIKIEHLLEVAILQGHDSLVLGAISCGAFRLQGDNQGMTAQLVAEAFQEVLKSPRYKNRFKNITFAVLASGDIGKINYNIFRKAFINNL